MRCRPLVTHDLSRSAVAANRQSCGYATEAATAMGTFGFTDLRVHRIWSWCVADNGGSARVLQKLGMRLEGRLWDKEYYKGRWWDWLMFAVLEDEWRTLASQSGFDSPCNVPQRAALDARRERLYSAGMNRRFLSCLEHFLADTVAAYAWR